MRPLVLTMQAFGPYRTTETVDFAELGDNRLFLIHGETGAGKTSILDAIVFALYGDTSGGERQAAADALRVGRARTLPTEVVFDFALGKRSSGSSGAPSRRSARASGAGLVRKQARRRCGRPRTRAAAARARCCARGSGRWTRCPASLLGFSSEQFRQVVVLPQGRFRELLAAAPMKREEILRQLFRTGSARTLERRLTERAREVVGGGVSSRWSDATAWRPPRPATTPSWRRSRGGGDAVVQRVTRSNRRAGRPKAAKALTEAKRPPRRRGGRGCAGPGRALEERPAADRKLAGGGGAGWRRRGRAARRGGGTRRRAAPVADARRRGEHGAGRAGAAQITAAERLCRGASVSRSARRRRQGPRLTEMRAKRRRRGRQADRLRAAALAGAEPAAEEQAGVSRRREAGRVSLRRRPSASPPRPLRGQGCGGRSAAGAPPRRSVARCEARDEAAAASAGAGGPRRGRRGAAQAPRPRSRARQAEHGERRVVVAGRSSGDAGEGLAKGEPCPVCGSTEHPAPARVADGADDAMLDAARERLEAARPGGTSTERADAAAEAGLEEARGDCRLRSR